VTIFYEYSPSHCKIPKLHVLRYHVISSIRRYSSVNGMSTETYEMLHKSNVKNPYRMTNKKKVVPQMLNTVYYIIYYLYLLSSLSILTVKNSINVIGTASIFDL
jgi:hypothetical protein